MNTNLFQVITIYRKHIVWLSVAYINISIKRKQNIKKKLYFFKYKEKEKSNLYVVYKHTCVTENISERKHVGVTQ